MKEIHSYGVLVHHYLTRRHTRHHADTSHLKNGKDVASPEAAILIITAPASLPFCWLYNAL